jgi:nucleoid DNA-binding protein
VNKRELIAAAARRSSLTQVEVGAALEAMMETIAEALAAGDHVAMSEFGRFQMRDYAGRELSRFGQPGCHVAQERRIPVFKPSAVLRRRVRERQGGEGHRSG